VTRPPEKQASTDFAAFLEEVRSGPRYAGQIVYLRDAPAREPRYADPAQPLPEPLRRVLRSRGIERLYTHQTHSLDLARQRRNVLLTTGTASGKTLCYTLPILEAIARNPDTGALLLFPTKALAQDQFRGFSSSLAAAGLERVVAGVYDGDTPAAMRRRLRERAAVLFSNPDMLHAALMPQHARWARFLADLKFLVLDELHVYNGVFGSNMADLLRRFFRVCGHYGADPQIVASSATIGNPRELAESLTGKPFEVVDDDGSARGRRTYVFWNPPRVRHRAWRSRRSANVEAHELMAMLIARGVPTITFSKAQMTAEMIHRYVTEKLGELAPHLVSRVTPYRGGYRPEERREIERRLFSGELVGVSTTPALELGIDVGGLDACILVGYPGTLASFFQQSGRAGRQDRDALVVLVAVDTAVNQYVMSQPGYLFDRPVEQAVIDPANPFLLIGHLRCAAHELALSDEEAEGFGPHARTVLRVLEENRKLKRIGERWHHSATETPQHEVSLRSFVDANVLIEDVDTGAVLGEINLLDAPPILHPDAIYMHQGDTFRVLELNFEKNIARVKRVEVDYYTQPLGGTDVHHVDHRLREKPFGSGKACWGEVTAYFRTGAYEKVHFYSLDAISLHGLDLPTFALETMAFWLVPPEPLMDDVRRAGLDAHAGLRGVGYATRMALPLFITCDTLDFSHTVGSANTEWNAVFVYERYPLGLGFTERAYERLHEILPAVLAQIERCPCDDGCPCCVGKPLRQFTTWNIERGEGSIPGKAPALMILRGLLGDGRGLRQADTDALTESPAATQLRLEQALRRRLERMREPQVFHPIEPKIETGYPAAERPDALPAPDVARRSQRRGDFDADLRRRLAKKISTGKLPPLAASAPRPPGMKTPAGNKPPVHFPGRPPRGQEITPPPPAAADEKPPAPRTQGDPLAAKARKRMKKPAPPSDG